MANPVNFSDLFNINNLQDLDKLIQNIEKLKVTLDGLKRSAVESNQQLTKSLNQTAEAAKNLNPLLEKDQKSIDELNESSKKFASTIDKQNEEIKQQAKLINKLEKELEQLKKARDSGNNAIKEQEKLRKRLIKAQSDEGKEIAKLRVQLQKQNKENKDSLKLNGQLGDAYDQLSAKTNKAQRELKRLLSSTTAGKTEIAGARKEFNRLANQLEEVDRAARDSRRNVGNYQSALKGAGGSAFKLAGVLATATVGVQGISEAFRFAFQSASEFGANISKLQAISGASSSEISVLEENAKELGSTTQFTASQVAGLQVEFSKLGFRPDEILNATEATLNLAAATGEGLVESATVAGNVIRSFGLDASETGRVTDVLASSFSSSALDLEKFRESIKLVAPIAKAANVDLETTTALLGRLADAGLSGSIAGTSLRNLLSKLSDANSDLSKELGFSVNNSEDLIKAFKELETRNIDLTKATELTDERSKAAFLTLLSGVDSVEALQTQFREAEGTAGDLAKTVQDNLAGDVKLLQSAFEGVILSSDGFISVLRSIVQAVTNILDGGLIRDLGSAFEDVFRKIGIGAEEATQSLVDANLEIVKTTTENIDKTEELLATYVDLSEQEELSREEKEELANVSNQLIAVYGQSIVEIDEETKSLRLNVEAIKSKIAAEAALRSEAAQELLAERARQEVLARQNKEIKDNIDLLKEQIKIEATRAKGRDVIELPEEAGGGVVTQTTEELRLLFEQAEKGTLDIQRLEDQLFNAGDAGIERFGKLQEELNAVVTEGGQVGKTVRESLEEINSAFNNRFLNPEQRIKEIDSSLKALGVNLEDFANEVTRQGPISVPNVEPLNISKLQKSLSLTLQIIKDFQKEIDDIEEDAQERRTEAFIRAEKRKADLLKLIEEGRITDTEKIAEKTRQINEDLSNDLIKIEEDATNKKLMVSQEFAVSQADVVKKEQEKLADIQSKLDKETDAKKKKTLEKQLEDQKKFVDDALKAQETFQDEQRKQEEDRSKQRDKARQKELDDIKKANEEELRLNKELDRQKSLLEEAQSKRQNSLRSALFNRINKDLGDTLASQVATTFAQTYLTQLEYYKNQSAGVDGSPINPTRQALSDAATASAVVLLNSNKGFYTGGYTGDGGKFSPAGVVHKGEYVANQGITNKHNLKNVTLDEFDRALEVGLGGVNPLDTYEAVNSSIIKINNETQNIEPIDYNKLAKAVGKAIPKDEFAIEVGEHLSITQKILGKKEKTIFKNQRRMM